MPAPGVQRLGPAALVVTGRRGGVSPSPYDSLNLADHVGDDPARVAENRRRAAALIGTGPAAVVVAEHGRAVRRVTGPGNAGPGDVLITTVPGLPLMALAADCVAAVLVAAPAGALAVLHAGWRGVAVDAAGAAVDAIEALGAEPADIEAFVGPAICPACYEVSPEVRDEVAAAAPCAAARTRQGTPAVDIAAGVAWQLASRGVGRIAQDGRCTFESDDLFSHRRDAVTGRHGVIAALGQR